MPAVMLGVFALTLFCSASLLFLIEPMIGKMMLPLLGGTPAVWNTCMVFFQAILLAGYLWAHLTTTWLGPRKQARLQMVVLFLPIVSFVLNAALFSGLLSPNENLILGREANPIPALLLVLTLSVGLPMFVVCTSAPLLQRWFSSTDHPAAQDPYFLYGASNFGSMLALIGYPVVVEPMLTLRQQQIIWVIGYGLLAVLVAACAVLMWKSRYALEAVLPKLVPASGGGSDAIRVSEQGFVPGKAGMGKGGPEHGLLEADRLARPVTWLRRIYWIALAAVPSSLMLGVTTYITTDIASIPLLWVLPLTLYLLTFIIVFAHISTRTQNIVTLLSLDVLVLVVAWKVAPQFFTSDIIQYLIWAAAIGLCLFSVQILRLDDNLLIHRVLIMVMPLFVLLLLFIMIADVKQPDRMKTSTWIMLIISLHCFTLFIVAMVCHGELAADRPDAKHLTEFFLWMSFGGVVGGLFNGLFAPLAFNAIVEYQFMLMVACLLLPPLGFARESVWARRADIALAVVFLAVGGLLIFMTWRDTGSRPDLDPLIAGPWKWGVTAIALGVMLGGMAAWRNFGAPPNDDGTPAQNHWIDRTLDVVMPLSLFVLVVGLYWGLPAQGVRGRVHGFAEMIKLNPAQFTIILSFGLPAVLCYTFVERSVRFGLGVGAIVLAAGYSGMIRDSALYQDRSFFGVLRVEESYLRSEGYLYYPVHRLVHGTTLHGEQIMDGDLRTIPLSYYHRTGPVGQVFTAYNTDPKRPMAVIGLGTGTMACYGLPGQMLDFYDIDPVVVKISYDSSEYFTFVEDAEDRGVNMNLILGDARLTFQPGGSHQRLKPLRVSKGKKEPERTFGPDLNPDFKYGLVVVDAFSSDAIPVHLITREAIEIYLERLLEDGVLCIHISNRYLDLQPVLANIVEKIRTEGTRKGVQLPDLCGYHMSDDDNIAPGKNRSHWVAITRNKANLKRVLEPARWERDRGQLSCLGAALWPSQAGTALAATTGLAMASRAIADVAEKDEPLPTEWKPLDTIPELERQLVEEQAELKKETDAKKRESIEKQIVKIRDKIRMTRKVGVWTDDYSNLLSVFSW